MNSQDELFDMALYKLSEELKRPLTENDVEVRYLDVKTGIITLFEKKIKKHFKLIPQLNGEWKIIKL